jgi:cytochrome c peroxidase
VRSLVSLRSRFDAELVRAGSVTVDFAGFSAAENRGKRLFFAPRSCASCHMQKTPTGFCGTCSPSSPSVFQASTPANNGLDSEGTAVDAGRRSVTGQGEDHGRFWAPSLRNVELTGPYMHDGRFTTLDDVLRFYAFRVRESATLDPRMASGGPCGQRPGWSGGGDPSGGVGRVLGFPMSSRERCELIAFLKTLTDRAFVTDPRFSDPFR